MVVSTRRTYPSRNSRRGVFRQPSRVAFRRRRRPFPGSTLRDQVGSDTLTVAVGASSTVLHLVTTDKSGSDTLAVAVGASSSVLHITLVAKAATDTIAVGIVDNAVRLTIGPTTGTWVSLPMALPAGLIAGSRIVWDVETPGQSTALFETSINNGASWTVAANNSPIPGLPPGVTTARTVLVRVTLNRLISNDVTPRVHRLDLSVDVDASRDEFVPLGVFVLTDTDITDGPDGVTIDLTGSDLGILVAENVWERIYTFPLGTNMGEVIRQGLTNRLPGARTNFTTTSSTAKAALTFGASGQNDPLANFIECAESIGMELYPDADGVWVLRSEPDPETDPVVWTFSDRDHPVIVEATRRLTRSESYNYIVVEGESSGNATPAHAETADNYPNSPTYYKGPSGQRTLRVVSKLVGDSTQALTMAQGLLLRHQGATETVEVDVVPMCALEPGDTVAFDRSVSKLSGNHLLDNFEIPLGVDALMHLAGRRRKLDASGGSGGGVGGLDGDPGAGGAPPAGGGSGAETAFTMAVGSCINIGAASCGALTQIKNAGPTWFALLGDAFYDDGSSNHVSHWNAQFTAAPFAALLAALPNPMVYAWSDHDFGFANNSTGAGNSITATANSAYRTQFPALSLPSNGIYRTWVFGRVRFILLDCLTFKSSLSVTDDSSKTMLGSTQKSWYKNLLATSAEKLVMVLGDGQIPGAKAAGQDEWRGYDTERNELKSSLNASPATVVYVNGDTHSLAYGHDQYGYDRCWQAAPLHNNTKVKAGGVGYIGQYPTNANEGAVQELYGIISFTDNGTSISATFRGYEGTTVRLTDSVSVAVSAPAGGGTGGTGGTGGSPANVLRINGVNGGTGGPWNEGIGFHSGDPEGSSHQDISYANIAGGYTRNPYFKTTTDGTAVQFQVFCDGGKTSANTHYPRSELRELTSGGGSKAAWSGSSGTHLMSGTTRVMHGVSARDKVVVAQIHDAADDTCQIAVDGTNVTLSVNGTQQGTILSGISKGTWFDWEIKVVNGQLTVKINGSLKYNSSPGYGSGQYFKTGCYAQAASGYTSGCSSSDYFTVEMKNLVVSHA